LSDIELVLAEKKGVVRSFVSGNERPRPKVGQSSPGRMGRWAV